MPLRSRRGSLVPVGTATRVTFEARATELTDSFGGSADAGAELEEGCCAERRIAEGIETTKLQMAARIRSRRSIEFTSRADLAAEMKCMAGSRRRKRLKRVRISPVLRKTFSG